MMTAHVFQAVASHAGATGGAVALRSGDRIIDYRSLAAFLSASAPSLAGAPRVVGIAGSDPLDAALADLALTFRGHVPVHLPPFFSVEQQAHIVGAAGIEAVIGGAGAGLPAITLPRPEDCAPADGLPDPVSGAQRIIFTSGSSGRPKGVVLGERQMAAAIAWAAVRRGDRIGGFMS